MINAAVLLSAWSAAASDIYISSRFLFFLSRCGHAPQIFASLFRYPRIEEDEEPQPDADEEGEADEEEEVIDIAAEEDSDVPPILVEGPDDDEDGKDDKELKDVFWHSREGTFVSITPVASSSASSMEDVSQTTAPRADGQYSALSSDSPYQDSPSLPSTPGTPHTPSTTDNGTPGAPNTPGTPELDVEQGGDGGYTKQPWFVLPLYAVLGSASVGLLSFLGTISGQGAQVVSCLVLRDDARYFDQEMVGVQLACCRGEYCVVAVLGGDAVYIHQVRMCCGESPGGLLTRLPPLRHEGGIRVRCMHGRSISEYTSSSTSRTSLSIRSGKESRKLGRSSGRSRRSRSTGTTGSHT